METPGGDKAKTASRAEPENFASDSSPVQESPCSNFLNNLSPLELKKAGNVPQGFIGINSPPLVFTSPRITLPLDAHARKRPQVRQLSIEELPQHNMCAKSPENDSKKSNTYLVTDNEDFVVKELEEAQPSNSSICIDGFLVDPITTDCVNSTCSDNAHGKEVGSGSPSDATPMKIIPPQYEQNNDADEHAGNDLDKSGLLDKSEYVLKKIEIEENQRDGDCSPNYFSNVPSDVSADHNLLIQQCQDLVTQAAGGIAEDKFNDATKSFSGSHCTMHTYQDCDNTAGASLSYLASRHDSEVITMQRGLPRRCLFDEARPEISSTSSSYSASNMMSSGLSGTLAKPERLNSTGLNLGSISSKNKVEELSKHNAANVHPHTSANFPLIAARPLGIGLHLNSVVSGQKIGHIATSSAELTGHNLSIKLTKSTPSQTGRVLDRTKSCIGVKKVKSSPEGSIHDTDSSIIHAIATFESPHSLGPEDSSMSMEHCADTSAKRKFNSDHAECPDGIDQMSPGKRGKKEPSTFAGDGCKRCNCRKSKCLKLYCDCFAAGLYCSEPCACSECFNRPEYQDKVNETRKQIESRNPSAFAPKIIETANQLPENDEEREKRLTLSLARHKRGCNCKRSQCLKKYCECFQANVGCSDNCRCEGCKNVYGTKQGYGLSQPLLSSGVNDGVSRSEKFEALAANDGSFIKELHDPLSLTPLTPSFQFSDHGKGPPRSRLPLQRIPSSPDSDIMTILSAESKPAGDADSNILQISNTETLESGMLNRITKPSSSQPVDGFSPKRESLLNLSHLTPRLAHPVVSSASSSKARNSIPTRSSRIVLVSKSGQQSSSSRGTLHGRISPITPVTNLSPHNRTRKNLNSGLGHTEVSEDDTPEILKEASTPTKSVNVNSPNRKRVSPPHRQTGSSSSVALKSGRKFILKSVPSFPPLTPCTKPGVGKNQNITDLQDESRKK